MIGNYIITRHGRVYSKKTRRWLKAQRGSNGYLHVNLAGKQYDVHRLVAKAFVPNPDKKRCVNHLDFNRHNNHYLNLEWSTHKENTAHLHGYGNPNTPRGTAKPRLSRATVIVIKQYLATGFHYAVIAEKYGLPLQVVLRIKNGITWKGVRPS